MTYKEKASMLLAAAKEDRNRGDHVAAGDKEKDAAALLRMADSAALVAAGTHWYHPLTGRLVPVRR